MDLGRLLLVDDDPLVLEALKVALNRSDSDFYEIHVLQDPDEVPAFLQKVAVSAILTDIHLEAKDGLDQIEKWKELCSPVVVIAVSGDNRPTEIARAFASGADGFLSKPVSPLALQGLLRKHLARPKAKPEAEGQNGRHNELLNHWLVGNSKAIQALRQQIARLQGKPGLNILIHGESGVGKERVARVLHEQEDVARKGADRPWVVVNMAALPPTLVESELFGVEKGAFTDARQTRIGKVELADKGDLFLDEIGDLPYEAQSKILRIVQEKYVERLGGTRGKNVEVRILSATNQNLESGIETKQFREDLYFRLAEVVLFVPPLRERIDDIAPLVADFLGHSPLGEGRNFSPQCLSELATYHWPGNVRELESTLKRSIAFCLEATISRIEWTPHQKNWEASKQMAAAAITLTLPMQTQNAEHSAVWNAWKKNGGKVDAASKEIGISKATFYRRLKEIKTNFSVEG